MYFAYGSNMSSARLRARVQTARSLGMGSLAGHRLEFHLHSRNDGSAKCDAFHTGRSEDVLHGVLFGLSADELSVLDRYEGRGQAYARVEVEIIRADGVRVLAQTYRALHVEPGLLPYDWYKAHVVNGAREHGLPPDYVAQLEAVPEVVDRDVLRRARELAIYA
ncbi:gamma-glutamylcyclotransferase family protein [Acidihalobacter aeolianus]|nr:gamma-glutamylcyclotransferase family protein [Acidihalobacter aeolianus]